MSTSHEPLSSSIIELDGTTVDMLKTQNTGRRRIAAELDAAPRFERRFSHTGHRAAGIA